MVTRPLMFGDHLPLSGLADGQSSDFVLSISFNTQACINVLCGKKFSSCSREALVISNAFMLFTSGGYMFFPF